MVRVFRSLVPIFTIGFFVIGAGISRADAGLSSVVTEEAKARFAKEHKVPKTKLELWTENAAREVSDYVTEIKKKGVKSSAVNAEVVKQILSDESNRATIEKFLASATQLGWKESFENLEVFLNQKNLSIKDLSKNSKYLSNFVSVLVKEEAAFTALRIKNASSPITETPVELVPIGTLNQGLRLLKALSVFVPTAEITVEDKYPLVKFFLSK